MTLFMDVPRRMPTPDDSAAVEAEASGPASSRPLSLFVLIPVLAIAVIVRLRMLLIGRSLWLDEAAIALNICGRSYAELVKPLDHDQAAPIGFLFIERALVLAFGPNEIALRLFPFLASIATLVLIYRFCARNLGRWTAVTAVALSGLFPALIYYSGEVKQYSSDIACALLIVNLASDILRSGLTVGRGMVLAVAGMIVIWISHPSAFVLAGAGSTLIFNDIFAKRFRSAGLLASIAACWLASFAADYFLFLKGLQTNGFLADYWESAFIKFPPTSASDLRVYAAVAFGIFESLFQNSLSDFDLSMRMGVFTAAAWLIGVAILYHQGQRRLIVLLVAPLCFAVLASAMHKYPLRSRLALFTAAATIPVIASGIAGLIKNSANRAVGCVLLAFALLLPSMQAGQFLVERPRLHDARSVLTDVARHWKPGDVVVADRYSILPFFYYRQYGDIQGLDRVRVTETELSLNDPDNLALELPRWDGRPRVWFLLDTALPDPANLSRGSLKVILDERGEVHETFSCRRYSAHLYDFSAIR